MSTRTLRPHVLPAVPLVTPLHIRVFIFAGLGKGVTISSIGVLLKAWGLKVTSIKIDPYLNIDAGTMNPVEHGEVFVLDDGGETDLDLGVCVDCCVRSSQRGCWQWTLVCEGLT